MKWTVADLCDSHPEQIHIAHPLFRNFGKRISFAGQIRTVRYFEDNSFVREFLTTSAPGQVLVVDGHASSNCALLGDFLAEAAHSNGWQGVIVNGCVRDTGIIGQLDLGVKALAAYPRKSKKENTGEKDVPVEFAGIQFIPGEYVYADNDGIIVSQQDLLVQQ